MATQVVGAFTATGQSDAFQPQHQIDFNISLWGAFVGTVQLERSFDKGVNWLPLTVNGVQLLKFSGPVSESWVESEDGVLYRLNCTSCASGSVNYRISQ